MEEIPPNVAAVGVRQGVRRAGKLVDNLVHIHVPDPVSQELCKLNARLEQLEKKLAKDEAEEE